MYLDELLKSYGGKNPDISAEEVYRCRLLQQLEREELVESVKRIESWISIACNNSPDHPYLGRLLLDMLRFTKIDLDKLLQCFLRHDTFPNLALFRGSGKLATRALIEALDWEPNHAIRALAWIEDQNVTRMLAKFVDSPPSWTSQLGANIEELFACAGWEFTEQKQKRQLIETLCRRLELSAESSDTETPTQINLEQDFETCCSCCHRTQLKMTAQEGSLSHFLPVKPISVSFCNLCTGLDTPWFFAVENAGDCSRIQHVNSPGEIPEWFFNEPNALHNPMAIRFTSRALDPITPTSLLRCIDKHYTTNPRLAEFQAGEIGRLFDAGKLNRGLRLPAICYFSITR